jgi:hypothetical protein
MAPGTHAPQEPHHESTAQSYKKYNLMYYVKGALAGGICCSITHAALCPVDVVKTRIQLDPIKYRNGMLLHILICIHTIACQFHHCTSPLNKNPLRTCTYITIHTPTYLLICDLYFILLACQMVVYGMLHSPPLKLHTKHPTCHQICRDHFLIGT